ncbi:MAG: Na/Pi cotransporter family protein, partial [Anaerolineae bacterium]|nr:Na/Pi cotransporter family protein [Anaerolineae bacterium]
METTNTIQIGALIMGLFGGLAIFLYGMEQMDNALKRVAGGKMKKLLAKATDNRLKGVATGAFVTAVVQSSSVTTVLVVGFISAGLMSLSQSIGVIMGANIGTTITAQIVAFKVTQYALVMVAVGFVMYFFFKQDKHEKLRQYGLMLLGLGLVFFGLTLMSGATKPLRTYQPFIDLMQQMSNPLLGILVGALFTALVQSSSATTGVIIVLASQGFITLEAGIALAFGANLGTCVTALLAAIGKPREAVQASMVHLVFNIAGVLLWFGFIDQLAYIVRLISPAASELTGSARLAAETPRQIANAHTLFNVANTAIFIWFTVPIARLMQYLIPERKTEPALVQPNYLDPILVETPELALDQVKLELGRLGGFVRQMLDRALPAVFNGSREDLNSLVQMDRNVDRLYGEIFAYLNRLSRENLLTSQSVQLSNYMSAANAIENIGN